MTDLVTIITPQFNAAETISETIQSVLSQTYTGWEHIVVDDGSLDSSLSIVEGFAKEDPRIKIIKRTSIQKGGSVCRNIGIRKAKGRYLLFLDADDLLAPDCIEERVRIMKENPNLDFTVFQMQSFGLKKILLTKQSNDYLSSFLSMKIPWTITSPIWDATFVKKLNGFDEQFERFQDPEFHVRALLRTSNYKVFYDTPADCFYRLPPMQKNNVRRQESQFRSCHLFISKFSPQQDLSKFRKKRLKRVAALMLLTLNRSLDSSEIQLAREANRKLMKCGLISGMHSWFIDRFLNYSVETFSLWAKKYCLYVCVFMYSSELFANILSKKISL